MQDTVMSSDLIIMRRDELRELISEMKQDLIHEIRATVKPVEVEQSVSAKEMAAHLKINYSTFWRRIKQGKYPSELIHRDAGFPRFYVSQFEKYIKGN